MMTCEIILAAALLTPAQAAKVVNVTENAETGIRPVDEQIEVMRALLLRKLGGGPAGAGVMNLSSGGGSMTFSGVYGPYQASPGWGPGTGGLSGAVDQPAAQPIASFRSVEPTVEGTYLDGYGVVFTVTLPATGRDPRPGFVGPKETPALSEWDREQLRLRGGPASETPPPASPAHPPVGELLLRLLAENGKHFTGFKEEERVTIAVTFRSSVASRPPLDSTRSTTIGSSTLSGQGVNSDANLAGVIVDRFTTLETMGDLHLRQGQPQKAIDAYRQAWAQAESGTPELPNQMTADRIRAARLKLAQANLAAGNVEDAQALIAAAAAHGVKASTVAQPAGSVAAPRPARLTISAPKKLLDQIGAGKMGLDEFRKQATVEYISAGKAAE